MKVYRIKSPEGIVSSMSLGKHKSVHYGGAYVKEWNSIAGAKEYLYRGINEGVLPINSLIQEVSFEQVDTFSYNDISFRKVVSHIRYMLRNESGEYLTSNKVFNRNMNKGKMYVSPIILKSSLDKFISKDVASKSLLMYLMYSKKIASNEFEVVVLKENFVQDISI